MSPRQSSLLALLSATGIGLLSYELILTNPTAIAASGLALVALASLGFLLSLRRMQTTALRTAMSTYADKQMQLQRESRTAVPSFDAPSTVL
jgi:hypothetical protein